MDYITADMDKFKLAWTSFVGIFHFTMFEKVHSFPISRKCLHNYTKMWLSNYTKTISLLQNVTLLLYKALVLKIQFVDFFPGLRLIHAHSKTPLPSTDSNTV